MTTPLIGLPEASEYAPDTHSYVAAVPGDDPVAVLREQIEKTLALFAGMDDRRASDWSYAPGKWTIKQVLGHLADAERIFGYRALRIGRGDETPLPGFEQDGYVKAAESNARPLAQLLEEFRIVRRSTLVLADGFPVEAWLRRGKVREWSLSVRGIFFTAAGHELHHYRILREDYKLGG
jgi:DinB superfamily